ncbi:MAG: TolC family protein [Lentisphaeria bacterium]
MQKKIFPKNQPEDINITKYKNFSSDSKLIENGVVKLNLRKALKIAASYSREYQTTKESLFETALSLKNAQHSWDWNPGNNLSSILNINQDPSSTIGTADGDLSISKRFLSGARLTAAIGMDTLRYFSGDHTVNISSLANLTITQPLLAGYGTEINRNALTSAEQNLIYALRSYVRSRESLLIDIANKYYAILNAEDALEVGKLNLASVTSSMERSKAIAEAGRVDPFQVDQARQSVLSAESSMVSLKENLQSTKDELKTTLGLPLELEIEVDPKDLLVLRQQKLPEPPMSFEEAVKIALNNRLDYANICDRLEDAARAVRIAGDAMRAKLNLTAKASAGSITASRLKHIELSNADFSIGLDADLPFDRTSESIALREAQIYFEQHKRVIIEQHDSIIASLRSVWRQLISYRQNYKIQQISVRLAEKRVESTKLLFEGGRINIRELLEAQDDLSSARNSLTQALVNHRLGWLRLLYQLEQLPVEAKTLWSNTLDV